MTARGKQIVAVFVGSALGVVVYDRAQEPGPDSQVFFDADDDPATGYGKGDEYIGRAGNIRLTQCELGDGGWPATVVGRAEFYVDGEWQPEADCNVECRVVLFDADGDGVVDLCDYGLFQNAFGQ